MNNLAASKQPKLAHRLLIVLLTVFWQTSLLAHICPCEQIAPKIDELVQQHFANAMFGLVVQDADSGEVLYEKSAHTAFVPASAAKLFSAAAALYELTPQFRFRTKIKYDKSSVKARTLTGPLVLEFTGDPSLTASALKGLVRNLKKTTITTITGNLIIDDSCFQGDVVGAGWSNDDLTWSYAGPISAIILDENRVYLAATSAKKLGNPTAFALIGRNKQYFKVQSAVKTVTWQTSQRMCGLQLAMDQNNNVHASGCWPMLKGTRNLKLAVKNPRKLAADLIVSTLRAENINFKGKVVYAKAPKNIHTLATHMSLPLSSLLSKVLGNSNNIYAEAITKTLGAKLYQHGSFRTGTLAIKAVLQQPTGINFAEINLVDGSGLSRYNLISPHQFARLLYTMYHSPSLRKPFANALALAGVKGTLRARLTAFDTNQHVRAKTGSFRGVSALSGYIKTTNHKILIFTMLVNNTVMPLRKVKKIEDELCQVLVNF